jgi:hypothetical protein
MAVVALRGVLHGTAGEGTVTTATFSLVIFAAVGLVLGTIAESTVDEAVRMRLDSQLAEIDIDT